MNNEIEREIAASKKTVILDFHAKWCEPCKKMGPVLEDLERQYGGMVKVIKVDVDVSPEVSDHYSVMSVPTLIFFKNGELTNRISGAAAREKLLEMI